MIKKLLVIALILLSCGNAYAAIAVGNISDTNTAAVDMTAVTSLTWAHTVAAGDKRFLVVTVHGLTFGTSDVTSITWNTSQNLKRVRGELSAGGGSDPTTAIWYLVAPTPATANIVVTAAGSETAIAACAVNFTGVDQTNPIEHAGTTDESSSPIVVSQSVRTNGSAIVSAVSTKALQSFSSGSGETEIADFTVTADDNLSAVAGYELGLSIGTEGASWTKSAGGDNGAESAIVIRPDCGLNKSTLYKSTWYKT